MYKFGRIPLAISVCAIFFRPPLFSTRTASSLKKTMKNTCTFQKKKIIKKIQSFFFKMNILSVTCEFLYLCSFHCTLTTHNVLQNKT